MKQKRLTKHLKIKILLFGVSVFLTNCQKDDDFKNTAPIEVMVKKPISISTIQKEQIIANKQVWSSIEKLKTELNEFNASQQNRTVYSDSTGLEIDTDFATYIEFENGYHSFTFLVTNTPDDGGLQNVLISLQPDNSYKEFLVHYNITDEEIMQIYQGEEVDLIDRFSMTEINAGFTDDILSRVVYEDECTRLDFEPNTCSSGAHEYGDNSCTYIGDDDPNTHTAQPGGTYTTTLKPCDMPTGDVTPDTSNPSNQGPHGSVGDGGNTSSPTTCGGSRKCVPVDTDPVGTTQDECDKITQLFQDYPTLKTELQTLKTKTNLTQERGKYIVNTATVVQNSPVGSDGFVTIDDAPSGKYICIAHTHNSPSNTTYSVTSWEDILGIQKLIKTDKIDVTRFVGFLFTADGTSYAYTFSDINQFNSFFNYLTITDYNSSEFNEKAELVNEYYFNEVENPLITENSQDNTSDLKHFLDLLTDNNMGVTLFKESDDFETFEKLTHNKQTNNVDETPCN